MAMSMTMTITMIMAYPNCDSDPNLDHFDLTDSDLTIPDPYLIEALALTGRDLTDLDTLHP